jgi:hypothetical protein
MRALIRWSLFAIVLGAALAPLAAAAARDQVRNAADTGQGPATRDGRTSLPVAKSARRAPVALSVAAGYDEYFRPSAWVPVRVTAHNRTAGTISGTIEVPDGSGSDVSQGPAEPYQALYQAPLVLPGGESKSVTLYVPGSSVGASVTVRLRADGVDATASDSPSIIEQASLSIGALSSDQANIGWLRRINAGTGAAVTVARLTPATVDAQPAALANFDLIAIVDGSISSLDGDQLSALERYVRNGGSLLLIGGPGWQETLRPLPRALVPGFLAGARTLPDLLGLSHIQKVAPPRRETSTTVSLLQHPQGTILASERGVPLAVENRVGDGEVLYLAFDPSVDPVAQWGSARPVLSRLILRAAPAAAGRPVRSQSVPDSNLFINAFAGPSNIGTELSNVRDAALPSIELFLILISLSIVFLGPANYAVLRRLGRQGLLWVTVPLGSLLCLGAALATVNHFKGNTVLVNTIGMVTLDGTGPARPAALYMGLFAPVPGDYALSFDGQGLPQYIPQFTYDAGSPAAPGSVPVGLRFQEGPQTQVQFPSMRMWSTRDVALHTTVNVPGNLVGRLHVGRTGDIIGNVRNGTGLNLLHPVIVAGRATVHLPNMAPGATIPVRVKPSLNTYDSDFQPLWSQVYGQPQFGGPVYVSGGWYFTSGPCCYGPSAPAEHGFADRVRDAATQIPDAQDATALGEVLLVAWSEQGLGSIRVDGSAPQRRDLNMVLAPLTVAFEKGPFVLRTGTFGAHLVDISPQPRTSSCCGPVGANSIDVAYGGSATFEFDLPAARRIHFSHLWLNIDAGGANGMPLGRLWDWRAGRWIRVDLSLGFAPLHDPDRFISPTGMILVKLDDSGSSTLYQGHGDLLIPDVHRNLQISGDGVAA